jgi:hypothetical protein
MAGSNLTERQQKWFNSVRASLERDTGKTLAEWVKIAKTCPEIGHRARLKWFKENHGLLQNRASQVLNSAFGSSMAWSDPEALIESVWTDPQARVVFDAVNQAALALPATVRTARKGYTAWSRKVQYAALRPLRGKGAMLGLAVPPDADERLEAPRSESWSERLKSRLALPSPDALDATVLDLLRRSWDGA